MGLPNGSPSETSETRHPVPSHPSVVFPAISLHCTSLSSILPLPLLPFNLLLSGFLLTRVLNPLRPGAPRPRGLVCIISGSLLPFMLSPKLNTRRVGKICQFRSDSLAHNAPRRFQTGWQSHLISPTLKSPVIRARRTEESNYKDVVIGSS